MYSLRLGLHDARGAVNEHGVPAIWLWHRTLGQAKRQRLRL